MTQEKKINDVKNNQFSTLVSNRISHLEYLKTQHKNKNVRNYLSKQIKNLREELSILNSKQLIKNYESRKIFEYSYLLIYSVCDNIVFELDPDEYQKYKKLAAIAKRCQKHLLKKFAFEESNNKNRETYYGIIEFLASELNKDYESLKKNHDPENWNFSGIGFDFVYVDNTEKLIDERVTKALSNSDFSLQGKEKYDLKFSKIFNKVEINLLDTILEKVDSAIEDEKEIGIDFYDWKVARQLIDYLIHLVENKLNQRAFNPLGRILQNAEVINHDLIIEHIKKGFHRLYYSGSIQNKKKGMIKKIANVYQHAYENFRGAFASRRNFIREYYYLIFECLELTQDDIPIKSIWQYLEKSKK
jgi:hypothetical protein